ncbi:MAG: cytochrome C peroxidase [Verrucomicrobia bacterium]|nr:cytochrome C peroxidase [Verrucomicrobiota bacterium]
MRFVVMFLVWILPLGAADLTLTIEPRWAGKSLAVPSGEVVTMAGQTLKITRLTALVSEVALGRADGGLVRLPGQYGVIDAESGRLAVELRGVPEGDYVGLELVVGLPPDVNHGDPGRWPPGHALNPLVNGLHWGWQGGYVFLALEGKWRAAASGAGRGFSYHLATDVRAIPVRFAAEFKVERATTVSLAFDLARVLRDAKLAADDGSESTHSGKGDALAAQLAQAAQRAWFWLEARATTATVQPRQNKPEREGPATPWAFTVPAGFPQPALPDDNPLTVEGVALGRKLFSEVRLSGNGTQSCASCHAPERAFSDAVALSRGAEGAAGGRNAMPLFNLAWSPSFAWDGSKPRVRDQAAAAMTNPIEMHAEPARVVVELGKDAQLGDAFMAAFGSREITTERIGLALEQYLLTTVSADSKFDRSLRGEVVLTEQEQAGFALFVTEYDPVRGKRGADCFHCHGGALFSDQGFKNNGLDLVSRDRGRALVTDQAADAGKFKTPSLRNVAVTGPYMHDGRFATLEEVVAHYDHGVKRAAALDPNLAKHPDAGLGLTTAEQAALVAFLKTLTDAHFAPKVHSSPSQ